MMNLDRAYRLLAAFYTLILMIGAIAILAGGGTLLSPVYLLLGALAVVGLWGYILKRRFMSPRMWRPLAGVLAVGILLQLFIMLTTPLSSAVLTWMLTSSIFPSCWSSCFTTMETAINLSGRLMRSRLMLASWIGC